MFKNKLLVASFALALPAAALLSVPTSFTERPVAVEAPAPVYPLPTAEQMQWHEMELNAFIHFTTNTFTGLEWGKGSESPSIFNPSELDASQWVRTLKEAGFKQVILTCKHHDGFCLWPSKYTEHSIKNSPYKNGKGDLVAEVSAACKKEGLKFGVYLSPWDRNRADYGKPGYLEYYRNQLRELFTNYGPVKEMWFDGANGGDGFYGGANEVRKINSATYYDWPTTLKLVSSIQPGVIFFSDAGPGVRWVGNEDGRAGETNWNTISSDTLHAGKAGISRLLNTGSEDGKDWIPAETDVSIRPGWFYHAAEDSLVKSPQRLFNIYLTSVGRGSTLLLNVPPDKRGLFHDNDVKALRGFRKILDSVFQKDLAIKAKTAGEFRGSDKRFSTSNLVDANKETYWSLDDGKKSGAAEINLSQPVKVSFIQLQEYIKLGQRVKSFKVEAMVDGSWKQIAQGTTIGYKRILKIPSVTTRQFRITIIDSKASPTISSVSLFS
jgi:alpha-L-fucosidase